MQGIEVSSPSWKIFGDSLRMSNDFVSVNSEEPLGRQLLKTKQIDVFQNQQNIIKNKTNKNKKCRNSK
jgi:hypothetical protein